MSYTEMPAGYLAGGWHAGIKTNGKPDFAVIYSVAPASAAAVFTRNHFAGNPVLVGREHVKDGRLQAIVVNSGNSNVATGPAGLQLAKDTCSWLAESFGIEPGLVLPSSTGVIGRRLPEDIMQKACLEAKEKCTGPDFHAFAEAIKTTDRFTKTVSGNLSSGIRFFAAAKGAGMIEPNMATMLCFFATDAETEPGDLKKILTDAVNQSFNRISVDSDTSTSDTVVILANGQSGIRVPGSTSTDSEVRREFVEAVNNAMLDLAKMIIRDGEGASRIFTVRIQNAANPGQAEKIGRSVINSPLVKTAVHGSDPNWGRLIMAVGKVFDEPLNPEKVRLYAGDLPLYPDQADLAALEAEMRKDEVTFTIDTGTGSCNDCFYGSALTEDYVKLNAEYTT